MHNNNKPFQIDKCLIYQSWLTVKANHGAAGVDKLDIKAVGKDYKNLLYKLWNRMSSGSYMASPIKKVEIPKNDGKGGIRALGIPTVLDKVAQTVVVKLLEPRLDPRFEQDSYGYRPDKSAHRNRTCEKRKVYLISIIPIGFSEEGIFLYSPSLI